jgi:peptidoglycan/xylan/chitin deacetylase (PgdA/CDA1 family)
MTAQPGRKGIRKGMLELPARLGVTRLWRGFHPGGTLVLGMHGVLSETEALPFNATGKFITPGKLEEFLRRLSRLYTPLSLDEFVDAFVERRSLGNRFVLTFDDGYANVYTEAFPLLREMGIPFGVFVTTGMVGTGRVLWNDLLEFTIYSTEKAVLPGGLLNGAVDLGTPSKKRQAIMDIKAALKRRRIEEAYGLVERICDALGVNPAASELRSAGFLTPKQIKEMARAGVGFGGHTVTHPILSRETRDRVREEVTACKHDLESITGKEVRTFAYPNGQRGDFDAMVKDEVRNAGYSAAFTGIPGITYGGGDPFEIRRLLVDCRWTDEEFETRASGILGVVRR